jgi:hypothetical protein
MTRSIRCARPTGASYGAAHTLGQTKCDGLQRDLEGVPAGSARGRSVTGLCACLTPAVAARDTAAAACLSLFGAPAVHESAVLCAGVPR